ncbi:toxin-antitoxin system, toxin component, HicA domain protein [Enterococcus faecalis 13-SD-W-01]|nr:toxin-antitoxin system, toxin component, HicA domain protein [Enterococcus faecalis 13-SD-W-01]
MRIMMKEGYPPVPIPVHNKDLKKGTEQKLLKDLRLKKS